MKKCQWLIVTALFTLLCGCKKDKDPVFNTDHPDGARVTLTTDWSNKGSGVDIPGNYIVSATGMEPEVATAGNSYPVTHLFAPGSYEFLLYSDIPDIPVTDGTATVKTVASVESATGTFIEPLPGWLFTGKTKADLKADQKYELAVTMEQQVRQLTFILTPEGDGADQVLAMEGALSGIAGELNISDNTYTAPSNVSLGFTQITAGEDAGKWTATVRLLGIAGEEQLLTARVSLAGESEAVGIEINLTEELAGFNDDKKTPLIVNRYFNIEIGSGPDPGPEPGDKQTEVILITDWNDRGSDVEIPSVYTLLTEGTEEEATGERYTLNTLFDAGTYPFYLYNKVPEITVSGGIATVHTVDAAYIHPHPGWFFTGFTEVTLQEEPQYDLHVTMHQQVRQLTLILKPEGENSNKIERITANLSGIASSLDLKTGEVTGEPAEVCLDFVKQQNGTWAATVRILGIIDETQLLSGMVYLTGNRNPVPLDSDLAEALQGFNRDKKSPLELVAGIEIGSDPGPGPGPDPDPDVEAGFRATIKDWEKVNGGSGIAI